MLDKKKMTTILCNNGDDYRTGFFWTIKTTNFLLQCTSRKTLSRYISLYFVDIEMFFLCLAKKNMTKTRCKYFYFLYQCQLMFGIIMTGDFIAVHRHSGISLTCHDMATPPISSMAPVPTSQLSKWPPTTTSWKYDKINHHNYIIIWYYLVFCCNI